MADIPDPTGEQVNFGVLGGMPMPAELRPGSGSGSMMEFTEFFRLPSENLRLLLELAEKATLKPRPPQAHRDFIDEFYRTVERFTTTVEFGTIFCVLSWMKDIRARVYASLPTFEACGAVEALLERAPEGFDVDAFLKTIPTDFSRLPEMELFQEDWKRFRTPPGNKPYRDRMVIVKIPPYPARQLRGSGAVVEGGDVGSDNKETTSNG
ncbi:MAG: hypothetical protein K2X93_00525 [Candidatus Obscuribacterales bacterium]|nr:hypothetical protein [Candidatus Obscuribacterales bacterium]